MRVPNSGAYSRSSWVILSLSCLCRWCTLLRRWPWKVCLPTWSKNQVCWFSSPSGWLVVQQMGVFVSLWGVTFLVAWRCDGQWLSLAGSFSVHSICQMQYAAQDDNNKLFFFAKEEIGFKLCALTRRPAEEDQEFTREYIFIFFPGCPCKKWAVITKFYKWHTNPISQNKRSSGCNHQIL